MRRIFTALALMLLASSAFAQETMDETTLRQRMITAEGKPPDSYREEISIASTADGSFVQREFHRGLDYKTIYGTNQFSHQQGRLEGREWDSDRNGLTTIHQPLRGVERPEKQVVTIERVHAPFEAWKLSRLNVRSVGSIQFIDAQTFQLRQVDDVASTTRETTQYDGFKTVDGYTFPSHWIKSDSKGEDKTEARVMSFEPGQVSDADIAMPGSRRLTVFPSAATSVEIPATFYQFRSTTLHRRSGRISYGFPTGVPYVVVHAKIGPRSVDLLLDSGSDSIVLDRGVVSGLGLLTQGRLALAPEIEIGTVTMLGVVTRADRVDLTLGNDSGAIHVAGLLGFDFIRSVGLTVDYENRRVTVVPAGSMQAPTMTPESDILPLRIGSHVPTISASINGATADQIVVDTGGSSLFELFDYFDRRYPEALTPEVAQRLNISRTGSFLDAKAVRLRDVQIGRYHLSNYDAFEMLSEQDYPVDCDGVIGPSFLQHFTVVFDYAGGKMYLVHNEGQ